MDTKTISHAINNEMHPFKITNYSNGQLSSKMDKKIFITIVPIFNISINMQEYEKIFNIVYGAVKSFKEERMWYESYYKAEMYEDGHGCSFSVITPYNG